MVSRSLHGFTLVYAVFCRGTPAYTNSLLHGGVRNLTFVYFETLLYSIKAFWRMMHMDAADVFCGDAGDEVCIP